MPELSMGVEVMIKKMFCVERLILVLRHLSGNTDLKVKLDA